MSTQESGPTEHVGRDESARQVMVRLTRHLKAQSDPESLHGRTEQAISRWQVERDFASFLMEHLRQPPSRSEIWNHAYLYFITSRLDPTGVTTDFSERLERLEKRQEGQEALMRHAIQPTVTKMARLVEEYTGRDSLPAASSAQYELHNRVADILITVENLADVFDDLGERLSSYTLLQKQLRDLLVLCRSVGSRIFRSAVITIHDAIHGAYSEDLTAEHVQVVRGSIERLLEARWDREGLRSLDKTLRVAGFETVPSDKFKYPHHV